MNPTEQERLAMVERIKDIDAITAAAEFLNSHTRGQKTLRALHANLLDHLRGLDSQGRDAYLTLLNATWGEYAGSTPEIIADVLEGVKS